MDGLTLGALAKMAAVNRETVRYYERVGLLPPPRRTPSGYRQYSSEAVQRLGFIKQAQMLGFSLAEIADLLMLQFDAHLSCTHMAQQARTKCAEIEAKIARLSAMREELLALTEQCERANCTCTSGCTALIDAPHVRAAVAAAPSVRADPFNRSSYRIS